MATDDIDWAVLLPYLRILDRQMRRSEKKYPHLADAPNDQTSQTKSHSSDSWDASKHPRGGDLHYPGRFSHSQGSGATAEAAPKRPTRPRAKHVSRLDRYRSPAVRRRVLHGLRNEAEFAHATGGHNLPDPEPADVMIVVSP